VQTTETADGTSSKMQHKNLGSFMAKHPELLEAFNACVNNSLTVEEF
jgi:hypothetical protein